MNNFGLETPGHEPEPLDDELAILGQALVGGVTQEEQIQKLAGEGLLGKLEEAGYLEEIKEAE